MPLGHYGRAGVCAARLVVGEHRSELALAQSAGLWTVSAWEKLKKYKVAKPQNAWVSWIFIS